MSAKVSELPYRWKIDWTLTVKWSILHSSKTCIVLTMHRPSRSSWYIGHILIAIINRSRLENRHFCGTSLKVAITSGRMVEGWANVSDHGSACYTATALLFSSRHIVCGRESREGRQACALPTSNVVLGLGNHTNELKADQAGQCGEFSQSCDS